MGLLLLIPGLVFLINGTEWFSAEDKVGVLLTVIGAVLILLQIAWFAFVAAKIKSSRDELYKRDPFDLNDFRKF